MVILFGFWWFLQCSGLGLSHVLWIFSAVWWFKRLFTGHSSNVRFEKCKAVIWKEQRCIHSLEGNWHWQAYNVCNVIIFFVQNCFYEELPLCVGSRKELPNPDLGLSVTDWSLLEAPLESSWRSFCWTCMTSQKSDTVAPMTSIKKSDIEVANLCSDGLVYWCRVYRVIRVNWERFITVKSYSGKFK